MRSDSCDRVNQVRHFFLWNCAPPLCCRVCHDKPKKTSDPNFALDREHTTRGRVRRKPAYGRLAPSAGRLGCRLKKKCARQLRASRLMATSL
jgi:hypothetical protein